MQCCVDARWTNLEYLFKMGRLNTNQAFELVVELDREVFLVIFVDNRDDNSGDIAIGSKEIANIEGVGFSS